MTVLTRVFFGLDEQPYIDFVIGAVTSELLLRFDNILSQEDSEEWINKGPYDLFASLWLEWEYYDDGGEDGPRGWQFNLVETPRKLQVRVSKWELDAETTKEEYS